MRLKSAGRAARHKLWNKETFLTDLRKHGDIGKVCSIYLLKDQKVGALRSDVWRWRKADPEFDAQVTEILEGKGTARPGAGRPPLDGGDKSWQELYCEALIKNNLNIVKAAKVTPYSVRQIEDYLDPTTSSYDEEFSKMVREAFLHFAGIATEQWMETLSPEAWADFETAKVTQGKAWNLQKMLEKLDPRRYGRRQVEISGTINHAHQHRYLPPNEKMALLVEDRKRFMDSRAADVKALASGERLVTEIDKEPIYEAEVVDES